MKRRRWMAVAGATLAQGVLMNEPAAAAGGLAELKSLPPSPRMPVLFIGHGSPMNAIEDNGFRRA